MSQAVVLVLLSLVTSLFPVVVVTSCDALFCCSHFSCCFWCQKSSVYQSELRATMIPTAAVQTYPMWVSACGKLAPMASIALYMAPLPTMRGVMKEKSVGAMPLLPHTTMITNAFLWMTYGALRAEPSVWGANGFGIMMSLFYFIKFIKYAPKASPTLPGTTRMHIQASIASILTISSIAALLPRARAAALVGNLGVAACILLFASPLVALKTVIQEKSAESIPMSFTIASLLCCFFWSVVGLKKMNDWVVYAPNLLGLTFGLIQLGLKLVYGNGNSSSKDIQLAV